MSYRSFASCFVLTTQFTFLCSENGGNRALLPPSESPAGSCIQPSPVYSTYALVYESHVQTPHNGRYPKRTRTETSPPSLHPTFPRSSSSFITMQITVRGPVRGAQEGQDGQGGTQPVPQHLPGCQRSLPGNGTFFLFFFPTNSPRTNFSSFIILSLSTRN